MMRTTIAALAVTVLAGTAGCQSAAGEFNPAAIIALEQAALERWGRGDPDGYFEIMAPDITYFDPTTNTRVDGLEALRARIEPIRGKIRIERAEMVGALVQRVGDMAVLTSNLISHGAQFDNGPRRDVRWNSTEIYRRIEGTWKIVHSHWSYTTPEQTAAGS